VPKIGKCALCHGEGLELQNSHFMPAGVYRVVRNEAEENPNPILFHSEAAAQTSKQITDFLLCRACEKRLSEKGENYFLKCCWRRDGFRLHAILDAATPSVVFDRLKIYAAAKFLEINVAALTYFAASMFWRDSVHHWKTGNHMSERIELGPYEEALRQYLVGDADFPQDCVLWVSVPDHVTPFSGVSLTPYGGRQIRGFRCYKLVVLGVGFLLFVGRNLPKEIREPCFVRGTGNPIAKTDMLEEGITQDVLYKFTLHPHLLERPK
jgi:hypothetical protein